MRSFVRNKEFEHLSADFSFKLEDLGRPIVWIRAPILGCRFFSIVPPIKRDARTPLFSVMSAAFSPIAFVAASTPAPPPRTPPESGRDVRRFYESVLADGGVGDGSSRRRRDEEEERKGGEGRREEVRRRRRDERKVDRGRRGEEERSKEVRKSLEERKVDRRRRRVEERREEVNSRNEESRNIKVEVKEEIKEEVTEEIIIDDEEDVKPPPRLPLSVSSSSSQFPLPSSSSSVSFQEKRFRYRFFASAQNGDEDDVADCLRRGVGVDERDDFGWSALHVAAAAARLSVVRLLLDAGADPDAATPTGATAASLAGAGSEVAAVVGSWRRRKRRRGDSREEKHPSTTLTHNDPSTSDFCGDCDAAFEDAAHPQSVAHLLNAASSTGVTDPAPGNLEGAVENRGFRLMTRMGWDGARGLGKDGEGRRNPIPTRLKRDRLGLGLRRSKARVTHFAANDEDAVRSLPRTTRIMRKTTTTTRTTTREEAKKKEKREREWEKGMRRYMNE